VAIAAALPAVLAFAEAARQRANHYLWGGSLGPDYDCSGFTQAAFAAAGVWIPRDAYQQERFCQPVAVAPGCYGLLRPGDLIFFGTPRRCTHVGLHLGGGRYLHSSGREHGRDGLGVDGLDAHLSDPVSAHYRAELRGAGRVVRCHDGATLP
jgi:cell wall-associated NlpC family hydrolase